MTEKPSTTAQERILALKRSYFDQLPQRILKMKSSWQQLSASNWDSEQYEIFHREIHSLAGSGETFGYRKLSQHARQLEKLFLKTAPASPPHQELAEQLAALLTALEELVKNLDNTPESIEELLPHTLDLNRPATETNYCDQIYILLDDRLQAEGLASLLVTKNYEVKVFNKLSPLINQIKQLMPLAVILDIELADSSRAGIQGISDIHQLAPELPVLAVTNNDDIDTRLAVLRAGSNHLLTNPLNIKLLLETLAKSITRKAHTPYRALIIDDDKQLSEFYAETLRIENIIVETLAYPSKTIDVINSFSPDIILLDIHMAEINGIEVAGLIRQFPKYDTIPVIFLSTETNIQFQLSAIDQVGDFIKKPVWPEYLITTVVSKCRHARKLKETQQNLENTLREYESQKLAMDQHSIVSIADKNGNITYVNNRFCDISGFSEAELIGKNHRIIKSDEHNHEFYKNIWNTISNGNVWHGEIKNRKRNGDHYWVESTIVPFLDESGKPYQYVSVRTDITEIKNNQIAQENAQQRLSEQNTALVILTNNEKLFEHDRKPAFNIISEIITDTLHIDRTSIWFFNDDQSELHCETLYDKNKRQHLQMHSISCQDLPKHIEKVLHERIIISDNVPTDNSITDERENYFIENDIISIMSAGIYLEGQCRGMICFETIKERKKWWPEDTNFATTIADFISLLLEQWERLSVQNALRESEFRLKQSQEFANIGTLDLEIPTMNLFWSNLVAPMLGYEVGTIATYENLINAIDPRDRDNIITELTECIENGDEFNREFRVIWPDNTIRWLSGSGNITYSDDHQPLHMLGVLRDITTRKQVQDALILAKENAEQANKAKSEFLSRMSHELRTPMNAVLGFAQLLEVGDDKLTDSQADSLDEILKAGRHLLELINEVLDLSKIEAGKLELICEVIHFQPILRECINLLMPLGRLKEIKIIDDMASSEPVFLYADRTRLKQVILNLLGNAIKYNKDNGSIHISASNKSKQQTRISFKDTGIGIPKEQQPYIFQAFERAGADNTGIEGTGIGLVITKHLVDLMGGYSGFTSTPHKGSTFWFELPREQEVADIHIHHKSGKRNNKSTTKQSQNISLNILYIEDNLANLKLVNNILSKRSQVKLTTAMTAESGLELARLNPPHLILLDINLPGMDGFEAHTEIKADYSLSKLPVIAITAQAMPHDIARYLQHGFTDYLAKPIDINKLLALIDTYIETMSDKKNQA